MALSSLFSLRYQQSFRDEQNSVPNSCKVKQYPFFNILIQPHLKEIRWSDLGVMRFNLANHTI